MAILLCLFTALMWWVLKKRKKLKKWWAIASLVLLGACSLASTPLGTGLSGLLGRLLSVPARVLGGPPVTASAIATVLLIPLLVGVLYDILKDHKADTFALVGLAVLPLLFIVASGPIANGGRTFTAAISNFASDGFGYLVTG